MKVLLADPPAKGTRLDDSYPKLGLLYLAGYLRQALGDDTVEIRYLGAKHDLQSHLQAARDFNPHIYGISYTSKGAPVAHEAIRAVKHACPDTWVIAGGCHPSALPLHVLEECPADVVAVSEGELTFAELVKAIAERSKPELERVQGIYFRHNKEILHTGLRPFIPNLDDIPFPAWDLVDFREYSGMHLKKQPIETSLLVSRGCPFHCTFCSQPVWKCQKPWLRSRSPENICQEIDLLYERGVRELYLCSDELNFNERWALDLCRAIAARGYPDLYFQCNMRADKVSEQMVEALGGIRCWLVHLGVESANNRVLRGIGKHVTVEQIENAVRLFGRAGIKVFAFMMLYQAWEEDGKLCFETTDEVENSLQWAKRMFRQGLIHYMSWQFCTPLPGSRLYDIAERHHLYRGDPETVWQSFDEHQACMNLPGIPHRTMRRKLKKGILIKDWFMVKSGNISLRHLWRAWENLAALVR